MQPGLHRFIHWADKTKENHSSENNNVNILARADRGVEIEKESIYVELEQLSLNRGAGLRRYIHHPPTMQYCAPFPDSLTTIHSWAHLAPASHMKARWVSDPQVEPMILKLRAHTYP